MESWFEPGTCAVDDPRRCVDSSKWANFKPAQHINAIYPRRDVAALIAACYPVVDGVVVMRYKPVFTTAAAQPYGGVPPLLAPTCMRYCLLYPAAESTNMHVAQKQSERARGMLYCLPMRDFTATCRLAVVR